MVHSLESQKDNKAAHLLNNSQQNLNVNPSTSTPSIEHNDQVMELFLHQVSEYNAQQLNFDDKMVHENDVNASNIFHSHDNHTDIKLEPMSHDINHLPLQSNFLNIQEQQQHITSQQTNSLSSPTTQQQQTENTSSTANANNSKRNKNKSKEGSSLLQVFTNPLLHAIPMLARNCLNFEDFLAQAAIQGQNGLLGSRDDDKTNNNEYTAPDSLMLNPTNDRSLMMVKPECPWHVRVLGLPSTGAKSRVETQIKICLQLTNSAGELATNWSHLMLPEHMVARDKLKRKNQKYDPGANDEKTSLAETDILKLEAAVVCDSHADNEIIMCSSCVHRERKRMKRKRDNKVARAVNKEGSAAKLAALFANDLPDLSNEQVMAEERRKILLFNCSEYVEFSNGEATLPTRVTCYCRHHSEKVGFRIVFTIKDCHNHVLGTGRSPPIMITDDHKSSKAQSATPAPQSAPNAAAAQANNRKRTRHDESSSDIKLPANSKRKAVNNGADGESDSGVSSPVASTPATPNSNLEETTNSPSKRFEDINRSRSPSVQHNMPSTSGSYSIQEHHQQTKSTSDFLNHIQSSQATTSTIPTTTTTSTSSSSTNAADVTTSTTSFMDNLQQGELYDFLNSSNINMNQLLPTHQPLDQHRNQSPQRQTHTLSQNDQQQRTPTPASSTAMSTVMHQQQQQLLSHFSQNPLQSMLHRRRTTPTTVPSQHDSFSNNNNNGAISNVYTKMIQQRQVNENNSKNTSPRLHRLIPSEGPIYGGSEVTVLGSNFYEGLTCLFGENPAVPTHCWSANTLLCILPPAASAGPVVVSFKEHPLMLEGQDVVLFTYFDESDRALMELALQVVGLKTMGRVEDARQIAMRIVQGDNNSNQGGHNNNNNNSGNGSNNNNNNNHRHHISLSPYRQTMTIKAAQAIYDNAKMLFYTQLEDQIIESLKAINMIDHRQHDRYWIKVCLSLTNRNKHTLLHLATICGYEKLVNLLLQLECNVNRMDRNGFTALHFASWTGKVTIVKALLKIGKSNLEIKNVHGKTALELAKEAGHDDVVSLFYNHQHQNQHQIILKKKKYHHQRQRKQQRMTSLLFKLTSLLSIHPFVLKRSKKQPLLDILPRSSKFFLSGKLINIISIITKTACVQRSHHYQFTSILDTT